MRSYLSGMLTVVACLLVQSKEHQVLAADSASDLILGRIDWQPKRAEDPEGFELIRLPIEAEQLFSRAWSASPRAGSDVADRVSRTLNRRHLVLSPIDGGEEIHAQWANSDSEGHGELIWWGPSNRAQTDYRLILRDGLAATSLAVHVEEKRYVEVRDGGQRRLRYNTGIVWERAGQRGPHDRGCYLHPIWSPSGAVVTGDFSKEHIHQRGLFTAWVKVRVGSTETDFWGLGPEAGRVVAVETPPSIEVGPVFARLRFENEGRVSGRILFTEVVTVTVYAGTCGSGWLFDLETRQRPVGEEVMEIAQVYYGGTSFRGPSAWLARSSRDVQRALARGVDFGSANWLPEGEKLDVLTSGGHRRQEGDRTRARWVDFTGPLGESWGGIAMFDDPRNSRYPTPLRIHPELPYFSWAVVQDAPLIVPAGDELQLRYRAWVHEGRPDLSRNERLAAEWEVRGVVRFTPNAR